MERHIRGKWVCRQCQTLVQAPVPAFGMPLLVHSKVIDPAISIFDCEAIFIERIMEPLEYGMLELKIVFEHITSKHASQYVAEAPGASAATITAHYLLYNCNEIFKGGIRPIFILCP